MTDNVDISIFLLLGDHLDFLGDIFSLPLYHGSGESDWLVFEVEEVLVCACPSLFILIDSLGVLKQAIGDGLELLVVSLVAYDVEHDYFLFHKGIWIIAFPGVVDIDHIVFFRLLRVSCTRH